jgi:CRP/FNR family nitrogen fixation transcriptional regulator
MFAEQITRSSPAAGQLVTIAPGLALPGLTMTFAADEEIFGQEEAAEFVYKVLSGAVRTSCVRSDGSRHIGDFHLPGDVFGLAAGATHRACAEAIVTSKIGLVRRSTLERAAERDGDAARQLWSITSRELANLQDHLLLLSHKDATRRVGAFLLKLSRGSSATLELPMSREDIGDHLGLTLETVSRAFGRLTRDQAIALPSARRVVLRNTAALAA